MKSIKISAISFLLLGIPALVLAGNYSSKTKTSMDIVDTAVSAKSLRPQNELIVGTSGFGKTNVAEKP